MIQGKVVPGAILHVTGWPNHPNEDCWVVVVDKEDGTVIMDFAADPFRSGENFPFEHNDEGRVVPDSQVPPEIWAALAKLKLRGSVL